MIDSFYNKIFKRIKTYAVAHKAVSVIVVLVVVLGGYYVYGKITSTSADPRYILGAAAKGSIVSSVSASGEVSALNQLDIKPKVTGDLTWIGVKAGDKVAAGAALMTIDNTSAVQAVSDAKKTLAADQLQYQKDTAQAPINHQNDLNTLATDKDNLATDYNNTFNDLTSTYLDASSLISGAESAIYGYDFDPQKTQWNLDVLINLFSAEDTGNVVAFQTAAKNDYATARTSYDSSVITYQQTPRGASNDKIDSLLSQSITMATNLAQSLQSELNFFGSVSDLSQTYGIHLPSNFATVQTNTRNFLSTANSHLSSLLADKKTLDSDKQAITNAEQTITLDQVGNPNGDNPISLQISKNNIEKEQQDIANQESDLAYYTITAPFSGIVATVPVNVGDTVGTGTAVATLITNEKIATLSLNEVDTSKIKIGDKATLTFDAIDGLSLTGTVDEIDTIGTVSQGVVSYNIQIGFDTQDARVKPGMTANAAIITDVKQNVLIVPSAAIKTTGGTSYVQVFNPPVKATALNLGITTTEIPQNVVVETGLSDDTNTEIVSGLTEGEQIVERVINPAGATAASTPTAPSLLGGGGGGGRVFRVGG